MAADAGAAAGPCRGARPWPGAVLVAGAVVVAALSGCLEATPTPKPAATATPSPSPSVTPTPSSTPTPTFPADAFVSAAALNVRRGPGVLHPIAGALGAGTGVALRGRDHTGTWLVVEAADGAIGWVSGAYLDTDVDALEVPTVPTPSPPPTPSPTPVPMDPAAPFVVAPPAAAQGEPVVVRVRAPGAQQVVVALDPRTVPLFAVGDGIYAGVLGVPVDTPPGVHQLHATAVGNDGSAAAWTADLTVWDGGFPSETITLTEATAGLLDAQLRQDELQRLDALWTVPSPERSWSGPWDWPVAPSVASAFGARRTYVPGRLPGRHTGMDLRAAAGAPVAAPAPGRVVLAEELTARGGTVVVDHGWGVYSSYFHLGRILVAQGDAVAQGDTLGEVGATGMVTGPHLHWEVRVLGVAVRPTTWTRGVATAVP